MSNQTAEHKTHYRKVFKSDHLGRADLEDLIEEGSKLVFTISHVRQEMGAQVAGKRIDANIAYFAEKIKPLVLNATNSGILRKITGSCFIENWQNVAVQLYVDESAKLKGEVVGGVRISPNAPRIAKPVVDKSNAKMWEGAKAAYKRDGNLQAVLKRADITPANQKLIIAEVENG